MIARLVTLSVFAYMILIGFVISTNSLILLIALASALPIIIYLVIDLYRTRKSDSLNKGRSKAFPFILVYVFGVLPPLAASIYLGYNLLDPKASYSIVVAYGITLGFTYSLMNIPFSIQHKRRETDYYPTPLMWPKLTVIVPAYNEQSGIGRTLDSLLESDYPNKEVIVVDDGSRDQTYNMAFGYMKRFLQGQIKIIRKTNGGKASAINYALRFARGDIIVVVDADSILERDALKELVKPFHDKDVGAVSGNVKILNRDNFWSKLQIMEYLVGISLFKRAYSIFGVVMVVPGCLGAFRKELIMQNGLYDNDTLTEDFDVTVKVLKTGKQIVMSSTAMSYTEVPNNFKDLYKQRIRWHRGNLQTLLKHKDIMTNSRFGVVYKYGYPMILLTMLSLPFMGMVVTAFFVVSLLENAWLFIASSFVVFTGLQFLLTSIAILMEEDDWKVALYAPLMVIGYKQILDFFTVKSALDVVFRKNLRWSPSARYGMVASNMPVAKARK